MVIEVKDYSKKIGKTDVLREINLEMKSGRIYGLKGKNGSGKTMLMRAISGLIKPTSGAVIVDGNVIGEDICFPQSIGVLLENPGFLAEYTGYKNLKLLADIKGVIDDEQIIQVLEKIGLGEAADKKYRKYSLGMKQKLGIAAAIMEKPEIVLLDEPTNALDENGVEQFRQILLDLKEEGKLIVWSSHDTEELKKFSDEIFVMSSGRIINHLIRKEEWREI
mgnify:CR=1 FL=1